MLATSAFVSAPKSVTMPASSQTTNNSSGEPTCAAMTPDFLKMPDPMTPPTTIIIVLNSPSVGTRPALAALDSCELPGVEEFDGATFNLWEGSRREKKTSRVINAAGGDG
jgi:hypothetical protein